MTRGKNWRLVAVALVAGWSAGCASLKAPLKPGGGGEATPQIAEPVARATEGLKGSGDAAPPDTLRVTVDPAGDPMYVEPFFSKEYGHLLLSDVRHVLTAPVRWEPKQWAAVGAAAAGIGVMTLFDRPFGDFITRNHNRTTDSISTYVSRFGAEYSFGVIGAYYVGGLLFDSPKARAVAQDSLAASIIASGMITPTLKFAFGRARRRQNVGAYDFDPFDRHNDSFPSGHTTQAFAVASVLAAHSESWWVKVGAYGTASLVGYARIQGQNHWPTDVAVGALIGTLVGNSVTRFNQERRAHQVPSRVSWAPVFDGDLMGLCVSFRWDPPRRMANDE